MDLDNLIKKYNLKFSINLNLLKELQNVNFQQSNFYKIQFKKTSINNQFLKDNRLINNYLYEKIRKDLTIKNSYNFGKRRINIFSEKKLPIIYIKKIDRILNFFDGAIGRPKTYYIDIYLLDVPKKLNTQFPDLNRNVVNSGSNLIEKRKVVIFRKEEWEKVLVHELIHYLNWHIYTIRKSLMYAFEDINTSSNISPNEGYTEFFALILYYFIKNKDIDYHLTRELAWGFVQSAKVLKYKNFNNYQELFSGEEYSQDSFLLGYFILKTYFLFKNRYQKCIKLGENNDSECFKNINLRDSKFSSIINYCMKNLNESDKSFKMSLT